MTEALPLTTDEERDWRARHVPRLVEATLRPEFGGVPVGTVRECAYDHELWPCHSARWSATLDAARLSPASDEDRCVETAAFDAVGAPVRTRRHAHDEGERCALGSLASDEGRDGTPFFPPEADDEPVTPQAVAGLLILHAEAVHGCQHTADFRDVIGMDGPRGEPAPLGHDLMSLREAGDALGYAAATLRHAAQDDHGRSGEQAAIARRLRATRIGRDWFVSRPAVEAELAARTATTEGPPA